MEIRPLAVPDAWSVHPRQWHDDRGAFLEWYRADALSDAVGHPLALAQANCSVSRRGVVRGIHFADVPPGQAKYVTCVSGAVLDVVVDLRVGSPTFGAWDSVELDDASRAAVYLAEGLGHGFAALTDTATVVYLCSEPYAPDREHAVNPMDPELGIDWRVWEAVLSPKDAAAPGLSAALESGTLPDLARCREYYENLKRPQSRSDVQ